MSVFYHEKSQTFHLTSGQISYLMKVLPNGALGQLYFGRAIRDREDFDHLLEFYSRPMTACAFEGNPYFSLEHCRLEYPSHGSTDFRHPAVELHQPWRACPPPTANRRTRRRPLPSASGTSC